MGDETKTKIDRAEAVEIGLAILKVAGQVPGLADGVTPAELARIVAAIDAVRAKIVDAKRD